MGQNKPPWEEKSNYKKTSPIARMIIFILIALSIAVSVAVVVKANEKASRRPGIYKVESKPKFRYVIYIGNWFSGISYYCHSFTLDGNTYRMYDINKNLLYQVTITEGYRAEVSKYKQ